ncbi:RHS repeat domain-containing protein, partial [Flavobacterium psychrophilum]
QNANENQEPPQGWPRQPVFNAPNDVPGPPVQFGPPITPTDVKAGEGFVGNGLPEKDVFYYHPDHLGSSSYISTLNGQISQHVEYIAFGEVLFEEHSSSFKSPYLFNGKELDRETNLSFYGARYLDMKTSLWLNVDPLAEKMPSWSPYSFCFNNPMRFVDPDGRAPDDWILSVGNKLYWYGGNVGDKSNLITTFKATSGNRPHPDGDAAKDYQSGRFQKVKDMGPTAEGTYNINLKPSFDRVAKTDGDGSLIRSKEGGVEKIPGLLPVTGEPNSYYSFEDWGENRAYLSPENVTGATSKDRDISSFYLHDSEKGYTHGCTEVEKSLFKQLETYKKDGNSEIKVIVQYPDKNASTNGGTEK